MYTLNITTLFHSAVPRCRVAPNKTLHRCLRTRQSCLHVRVYVHAVDALTLTYTHIHKARANVQQRPTRASTVQGGPSASGKWVKRINSCWLASRASCLAAQQKQCRPRRNKVAEGGMRVRARNGDSRKTRREHGNRINERTRRRAPISLYLRKKKKNRETAGHTRSLTTFCDFVRSLGNRAPE